MQEDESYINDESKKKVNKSQKETGKKERIFEVSMYITEYDS